MEKSQISFNFSKWETRIKKRIIPKKFGFPEKDFYFQNNKTPPLQKKFGAAPIPRAHAPGATEFFAASYQPDLLKNIRARGGAVRRIAGLRVNYPPNNLRYLSRAYDILQK